MFKFMLDAGSLTEIADAMKNLIQKILGPVLIVIGVAAVAYAVYLGVMYAKAEDANKRKEVQGRLIGALIGAVIIIAGVTLCYAINWVAVFNNFAGLEGEDAISVGSLVRLMAR